MKPNTTSKRTDKFTNLQIKTEYKKKVEQLSYELSAEFTERVSIAKVLYTLIDNHLEDARKEIRNEMNFVGK
jgi:hypothetical protein